MFGTNKRSVESFVVAKPAQSALATSTGLYNSSTGNVNLNDGQLGFVATTHGGSIAMNNFTDGTPTVAEAPVLSIYQGTANSAAVTTASSTYPLWPRVYEKTMDMDGRTGTIQVTKQAFAKATHCIWEIGKIAGVTLGAINIVDDTPYILKVVYRGRRQQIFYGNQQDAFTNAYLGATDFTTLGLSGDNARDYVASKLVMEINRNSYGLTGLGAYRKGSDPVVAFLVGTDATGTAISGLVAGSTVTVSTLGGINQTITLTDEMATSLVAAGAASSFTHILTATEASAGTSVGGLGTGIWLMSLDEKVAYLDYIAETKIQLEVGLTGAFNNVTKTKRIDAFEGQGYGSQIDLFYKATQGQRKYWGRHQQMPVITFPSDISTSTKYVMYNVEHGITRQIDTFNMSHSPYRDIILIPAYSSGTTTNAFIATFDTAFNGWLSSGGNSSIVTL